MFINVIKLVLLETDPFLNYLQKWIRWLPDSKSEIRLKYFTGCLKLEKIIYEDWTKRFCFKMNHSPKNFPAQQSVIHNSKSTECDSLFTRLSFSINCVPRIGFRNAEKFRVQSNVLWLQRSVAKSFFLGLHSTSVKKPNITSFWNWERPWNKSLLIPYLKIHVQDGVWKTTYCNIFYYTYTV